MSAMTGFIFPGQGSQYVGMGKDLCGNFKMAREIFEEADDTLRFSLSGLCFDGPEDQLKLTENTQPAILTTSYAVLRVLREEKGIVPRLAAGHSLGEYSALVAAGCLAFRDAVGLVRLRGRFMQEAVPVGVGAMAAILGMNRDDVETICRDVSNGEVVAPANFNCPGQIAISGHAAAVNRAVERVKQQGKKAMILPVSAPFHSPLMKEAGERLAQEFDKIFFNDLQVPVVTNVEAEINTSKEKAKALLVVQVSSPVRWEESMQRMIAEGVERMVEIGPGKVLCGMMKRINPAVATGNVEDTKTLQALSEG